MIILQIIIGLLTGIGFAFVLADVLKVPSYKASKATNNLGRKGDKHTSVIEIYLRDIAAFVAKKLRLNEYKRAQLESDLITAGMSLSPEEYVANAVTKAFAVGIFAIPAFFILPIIGLFILGIAVFMYFRESKAVSVRIKERRQKIEYELPRMVNSIEKTLKHSRDVIYILESYKDSAGAELKKELEITIADMRSGSDEVALTRLESRIGSTMMSDVTRGLISVIHGDDTDVFWASLSMKFSDYQRQQLKQQANSVPRKVRKLSMALLFCFILIYVAVIGQVLVTSLGTMF